jgi:MFS family permease
MLLGWVLEGMMLPVVPLLILARGGDALTIGFVAAVYALPSIAVRPLVGAVIDRRGHDVMLRAGATGFVLAPLGFLVPTVPAIALARFAQGVSWTMYSTATHVVLARLAPSDRRGEASGYSSTARAVGLLIGPPLGIALFGITAELPFLIASVIATVAVAGAVGFSARFLWSDIDRPKAGSEAAQTLRSHVRWALEPSVVPAMLIVATFVSSQMLFVGFAPVFAATTGALDGDLALFYAAFAAMLALAPLLNSRISDRIGRRAAIFVGCGIASLGLSIGIVPSGMATFTVAGLCVAFANSVVLTAVAASAIDVAPPGRLGSSLATYAIGFQLASGLGGALWGSVIATLGYPWPFVVAIGLQLTAILIASTRMGRQSIRSQLHQSDAAT